MAGAHKSAHTCAHIIRWVPLCCYYTKAVLLVLKKQTCGALARKASTVYILTPAQEDDTRASTKNPRSFYLPLAV